MSKATVDTITITVGKHKLTLTLAEAKALRETLNDTLGKREVVFPYIPPQKEYVPVYPSRPLHDLWWATTTRTTSPLPELPRVTCHSSVSEPWCPK